MVIGKTLETVTAAHSAMAHDNGVISLSADYRPSTRDPKSYSHVTMWIGIDEAEDVARILLEGVAAYREHATAKMIAADDANGTL
jgi:hypothetical protein